MTIPALAMVISLAAWLLAALLPVRDGTSELVALIKDMCRIIFAASVLVLLWANVAERAF